MPFLIVPLLAFSVPLFIGATYQRGRGRGAIIGAAWLLLALFLAGLNFGTGVLLAFTYPYYSAAVFAAAAGTLFFAGPGSALWKQAASLRLVRIAAIRLRRAFHRRGLSRRLAGDVAAMAAALLVLAPVSFLTLRPDPAYEYATGKLRRELVRRLPDAGQLAKSATAQAQELYRAGPGLGEREAAAAAERSINDSANAVHDLIAAAKTERERIDRARGEVGAIADAARAKLLPEMDRASRQVMADVARRILDGEQTTPVEAARNAMEAVLAAIVERARQSQAGMPIEELRGATERLIETSVVEIEKAGRHAAASATQGLLEAKRAEIEEAGRKAARDRAEDVARAANAAMAGVEDRLKRALEGEEASRIERERKRQEDAERLRKEQERRQAFEAQVEQSRIQAEKIRAAALDRFVITPRTSFAGGKSFGHVPARNVAECAIACLSVGCEAFAFQTSYPNACYRYDGRAQAFGNEYYTGGRLR